MFKYYLEKNASESYSFYVTPVFVQTHSISIAQTLFTNNYVEFNNNKLLVGKLDTT